MDKIQKIQLLTSRVQEVTKTLEETKREDAVSVKELKLMIGQRDDTIKSLQSKLDVQRGLVREAQKQQALGVWESITNFLKLLFKKKGA